MSSTSRARRPSPSCRSAREVGRFVSKLSLCLFVNVFLATAKCIPILLYGLEACPLFKSDLLSLDFVVNRLFKKLFKTSNIDVVKCCQDHFGFDLPSVSWSKREKEIRS